jgi:hypothetical protein
MNKLVIALALCSIAKIAGSSCDTQGQPPQMDLGRDEKILNTGAQVDGSLFDFYNPIIEKMCKENPSTKGECDLLVRMAHFQIKAHSISRLNPKHRLSNMLVASKLLFSDCILKPEVDELILASLAVQLKDDREPMVFLDPYELTYTNPLKQPAQP